MWRWVLLAAFACLAQKAASANNVVVLTDMAGDDAVAIAALARSCSARVKSVIVEREVYKDYDELSVLAGLLSYTAMDVRVHTGRDGLGGDAELGWVLKRELEQLDASDTLFVLGNIEPLVHVWTDPAFVHPGFRTFMYGSFNVRAYLNAQPESKGTVVAMLNTWPRLFYLESFLALDGESTITSASSLRMYDYLYRDEFLHGVIDAWNAYAQRAYNASLGADFGIIAADIVPIYLAVAGQLDGTWVRGSIEFSTYNYVVCTQNGTASTHYYVGTKATLAQLDPDLLFPSRESCGVQLGDIFAGGA